MGRKRAAFPEGVAQEEQRYAQVLRDIRDLRGETQQALGRLLGWSGSMVSRFEAAAERPDEATHRHYCAPAPNRGAARAGSGGVRGPAGTARTARRTHPKIARGVA
jgi:hypothetical protein